MEEEQGGGTRELGAAAADNAAAVQWRRTLWVMVGIQFIMTGAFSMLSPIMPLLLPELGVETASAVDLWAGILNGVTSFVAAFASPVWGRT
jgi:DHA1 family multidrug resistance protein-like MFS transporter